MDYIKAILLGLLCAICLGFGFWGSDDTLKVAAAANLASVAAILQQDFQQLYPEAQLQFIFNASGTLTTQITKGAPFDLFLSADMTCPEKLKNKGLVILGPTQYASGRVVLFTTRKDLDLSKGLFIISDPSIKLISIAKPVLAPYGAVAVETLQKAGLWESIKQRVVYAGSISQAFQYTISATDIGFIAKSSLYGNEGLQYNVPGTYWIDINGPVPQGMVTLSTKKYVQEFYMYMLSARAQKLLEKYGYSN